MILGCVEVGDVPAASRRRSGVDRLPLSMANIVAELDRATGCLNPNGR
jgi:hypothetical protein